jgi:hypothetical protein
MMAMKRLVPLMATLGTLIGCKSSGSQSPAIVATVVPPAPTTTAAPTIEPRALPTADHGRARLRWKRFRALQNDLARALDLSPEDVCKESSGQPCATGGPVTLLDWLRNEGVEASKLDEECKKRQRSTTCIDGPYIPFDNPRGVHIVPLGGNNTMLAGVYDAIAEPVVTTPIVLERFALAACSERASRDALGQPKVFASLNLGAEVALGAAGTAETVTAMYQKLLGRNPTDQERDGILSELLGSKVPASDFARLTCFTVATLPEFVFQ